MKISHILNEAFTKVTEEEIEGLLKTKIQAGMALLFKNKQCHISLR